MMAVGPFATEGVAGAAIRAGSAAGIQHVQEYAWMACPQGRARTRAMKRQIMRGNTDFAGGGIDLDDHAPGARIEAQPHFQHAAVNLEQFMTGNGCFFEQQVRFACGAQIGDICTPFRNWIESEFARHDT